jgi:predicted nucleotidyltransferase
MPEKELRGLSEFRAMREHLLRLEKRDEEERYHKAWKAAREVAVMLKDRYEVKEVYLYGSLAWGGFDRHSDIDLFLVGFEGNYWQACSEAEAIATPVSVSLACEEDCFDSLKEKVRAKGVLL